MDELTIVCYLLNVMLIESLVGMSPLLSGR